MTPAVVTIHATKQVHYNPRALRPLRDVTQYVVYGEDGKVQIQNTNKATVIGCIRRRYGKDAVIEIKEHAR